MKTTSNILTAAAALALLAGSASGQMSKGRTIETIASTLLNPGLLDLRATVGQQQIEITVGPLPGQVQVSGIGNLPNGGVYEGITHISLTTGAAQDFVEFRLNATVLPSIMVNTGGGNSDVKFTYDIPTTPDAVFSNVMVGGSTGNDVVTFNVESRAASFTADWAVTQGNGANEVVANINSPELSDNLAMNLTQSSGTGADKLEVLITAAAANVSTNIAGNLGANTDTATLNVTSLVPTNGASLFNYSLGTGNDSFTSEIIVPGSNWNLAGSVFGSDGFDTLVFKQESDGNVDLTLDGGAGNDLCDIFYKGFVTGSPRLLGGNGNDELKIVVDGPILAAPFIDGGAGIDKAIGFGTIINVEEIN